MNASKLSWSVLLVTGVCVLLCVPAILLARQGGWPQAPFHITQSVATLVCFLSSIAFLQATRGTRFGARRIVAVVAVSLSGIWLALIALVIVVGALAIGDSP